MLRNCKTCEHFCPVKEEGKGECHINPPVFFNTHREVKASVAGPGGGKPLPTIGGGPTMLIPMTHCGWPPISLGEGTWCGKWEMSMEKGNGIDTQKSMPEPSAPKTPAPKKPGPVPEGKPPLPGSNPPPGPRPVN